MWLAKISNTPPQMRRHTGFEYKNEMYIYGGDLKPVNREDHPLFYSQKIYKYNPKLSFWSEIKQKSHQYVPEGRFAHVAVIYGDSLFIFAGITSGLYLNNLLFEYNFNTNEWNAIEYKNHSVHTLFMFAHVAVVYKDKMILYGGESISSLILNTIIEYDFTINTFNDVKGVKGDIPLHGRFAHSAIEYKGKMYIFGGKNDNVGRYNTIITYDIEKKYWKEIKNEGNIPSPRAGHSMTLIGDSFYIFGGFDGKSDLNDLYSFNLKTLKWTLLDDGRNMPQYSSFHTVVGFKEKNEKLLLYGGLEGSDDSFRMYDTLFEYQLDDDFSLEIFKKIGKEKYLDLIFNF